MHSPGYLVAPLIAVFGLAIADWDVDVHMINERGGVRVDDPSSVVVTVTTTVQSQNNIHPRALLQPSAAVTTTVTIGARPTTVGSLGCWFEGVNGRALAVPHIDQRLTITRCQFLCDGFSYFGVENGRDCYCGHSIQNGAIPADLTACDVRCAGNRNEVCGGNEMINIYQVQRNGMIGTPRVVTAVYEGCYLEPPESRALTKVYYSTGQTQEKCLRDCAYGGYGYAGVEGGTDCWCGNFLAVGTQQTEEGSCSDPCGGNSLQSCGGPRRLSLYRFIIIPPPVSTSSSSSSPSYSYSYSSSASSSSSSTGGGGPQWVRMPKPTATPPLERPLFWYKRPVIVANIHEGIWPLPGYNAIVSESLSDPEKGAEFSSPGFAGNKFARKIDLGGSASAGTSYTLVIGNLALRDYNSKWIAKFNVKSVGGKGCAVELSMPRHKEKKLLTEDDRIWQEIVTEPLTLSSTSKLELLISCPGATEGQGGTIWMDDVRLYQVL